MENLLSNRTGREVRITTVTGSLPSVPGDRQRIEDAQGGIVTVTPLWGSGTQGKPVFIAVQHIVSFQED